MQRTPEWYHARMGKITASRFADVLTNPRSKSKDYSDTALSYCYELVGEILTGEPTPSFSSIATEWGIEHEPAARKMYEFASGNTAEQVAFLTHPEYKEVGASPDALIDDDGYLEIKCPITMREHVRTLATGMMPAEHMAQVQGGLWVSGRQWCDFVSYHPKFPNGSEIVIIRIDRDESFIAELEIKVLDFSQLIQRTLARITGKEVVE